MAQEKEWEILISGEGGFCPSYDLNTYPYYGNRNQASSMRNINAIDPNVITQGPGAVALTGGSQAGELGSVLITSILPHSVTDGVTYACGADKVFQITPTAVSNGNFPKTISAGTANVSTSLVYYKSKTYIFWNDTGVDGDIGLLTNSTTWDHDWGSTVPTGATNLLDAPHYGIVGGDDILYFTNGKYIGTYNGTTLNTTALDIWTDAVFVSLTWNWNRVVAAYNRPNIAGSNFNQSAIYKWNGVSSSWEGDPIEVEGQIGALYTKNGTTFVWWSSATSGYCFGRISGGQVVQIRRYSGSLPTQAQVGEYDGFIGWISGNRLMLWGARDNDETVRMFQYMSGEYATAGGWAAPFGTPLIASYTGATYSLAKASGYTVDSLRNSVAFKMTRAGVYAQLDLVQVATEQLSTGAKADFTITYNQGKSTVSCDQIAYSAANTTLHKILGKGPAVEDFRVDISFANGSATNPVKIRSILIKGRWVPNG